MIEACKNAEKKCQPDEIPAAEPEATRDSFLSSLFSNNAPIPLAMDAPISTLGPSGPNEFPVPRVTAAATALKNGLSTAFKLDGRITPEEGSRLFLMLFNTPTITPPQTGTNITRSQIFSRGSSLNQDAPREGIPSQKKSRISCT